MVHHIYLSKAIGRYMFLQFFAIKYVYAMHRRMNIYSHYLNIFISSFSPITLPTARLFDGKINNQIDLDSPKVATMDKMQEGDKKVYCRCWQSGKSAFVLLYYVNTSVQYEVLVIRLLHLTFFAFV